MSQFAFLKAEFAEVHALAVQAESVAYSDPRVACVYARLALETVVNWLYRHDGSLKLPYERTLAARICEATFRTAVGQAIVAKARIVKDLGNTARGRLAAALESTPRTPHSLGRRFRDGGPRQCHL